MERFAFIHPDRRFILVTGHRRENLGEGIEQICSALLNIARKYSDIDIVYPVHLNPNIQKCVKKHLLNQPNIYLLEPVDYLAFVFLMQKSYLILTDSGGIQEEAPSLGKPVLVMRNHTERTEALEAGTVKLVGNNAESIINEVSKILDNTHYHSVISEAVNPYGDGKAAQHIVKYILKTFNLFPTKIASINSLKDSVI
jgi:UDP-N-acetylglucosamine 2-epimerase (non-hydrolysing)